ncbi:MAG: hypothetical protein BWY63_03894 [Chloroflexi bacterium ADurb.Bin360]|nr:MAG: hypothetical protein BWY63_03894 [Chloroflexi bacterium ADurb.Bin360]
MPRNLWVRCEEFQRLLHVHVQHLSDVLALVTNLQGLPVVARALAFLTRHPHIGKEVHLDTPLPVSLARLATTALLIEAKAPETISTHLGFRRCSEYPSDFIKNTHIGRRIRAWCPSNRVLSDVNNLVQMLQTFQPFVWTWTGLRAIERARQRRVERLRDQATLAAAAHTGNTGQHTQRETCLNVLEIVQCGSMQDEAPVLRNTPPAVGGDDAQLPAQITSSERARVRHDLLRGP